MTKMRALAVSVLAVLLGCGGSDHPASSPGAEPAAPPRLPPSMGGGGPGAAAANPPAGDMPKNPQAAPNDDLSRGHRALESGDIAGAKAAFEAALKKNPRDPDAVYALGLALEKGGDKAGGERQYREALKLRPDHEQAAENLAALLIENERYDDAVAALKAAAAKHNDNPGLHLNLAVAYAGKKDQSAAAHEFDEALRLTPSDPAALLTYGHWLVVWKQPDQAVAKLRAARPLAKDDVGLLWSIGRELRLASAFSDCVPTFDKAIAAKDMAELRTERAICKMALKDNAGALADLQAAVQRDPSFALAHYYLGGRLAEQRKAKEATAEYEQYLKLAPNGPMAKPAAERIKVLKQVR